MKSPLAWLAVSACTACATAQAVVLPSAVTAPLSNVISYNLVTFSLPESHTQLVYDVADIAPPAAQWSSLQLRQTGANAAVFTTLAKITLAVSTTPASGIGTVFANNLAGPISATVYSGQVSLPISTIGPWPPAWLAPIPFAAPFVFVKAAGKSLIVDVVQIYSGAYAGSALEAWDVDYGWGDTVNSSASCKLGNGAAAPVLVPSPRSTPYLGSPWTLGYTTKTAQPLPRPAFAMLGLQGPGSVWQGLALPIGLGPFGAPGCSLDVSMDLVSPVSAPSASSASASVVFALPNQTSLVGQVFYEQGLFLDPSANAWGVVTGSSHYWRIGSGQGWPGALVGVTGFMAASAPTGSVWPGKVTLLQLN